MTTLNSSPYYYYRNNNQLAVQAIAWQERRKKHTIYWTRALRLKQLRMFIRDPSRLRTKELSKLGRTQLRWTIRLFTGYSLLMKYIFTNTCECTEIQEETKKAKSMLKVVAMNEPKNS